MKLFMKLLFIGVVSGFTLGGFLGIIQQLTHKKVYTLLVNIDYIPVAQDWEVGPVMDFSFHLIVSIAVVFVLYFVFKKLNLHRKITIYIFANVVIGSLLFSVTALSERTPAVTDAVAFSYWVVGHAIYGASVGMMINLMSQKESIR